MPEPLDYRALVGLQQALQGISVAAGYFYDVRGTAVKLDPNHDVPELAAPDGPRPFVVLEIQPEEWEYAGAMAVKVRIPVAVHWISESNPERDHDVLQVFLRGCSDVERAIGKDVTLGNLVRDTKITRRTFERAVDGSEVWAVVQTVMVINRVFGEPAP
jgi:hypothetical protein